MREKMLNMIETTRDRIFPSDKDLQTQIDTQSFEDFNYAER
jgi:hypothetical protein